MRFSLVQGLTCTVYTARIPGRKAKVIAKVARPRNKGRLEDQAERQLEAEFNVLRQASPRPRLSLLRFSKNVRQWGGCVVPVGECLNPVLCQFFQLAQTETSPSLGVL